MRTGSWPRRLAPMIPYIAVLLGIYFVRSVWFAILAYHVGVVTALYLDRSGRSRPGEQTKGWGFIVTANLVTGALTGVVLYALWPTVGIPADLGARLHRLGLTSWAVFGTYYCLVNPVLEEIFWRRYLASPSTLPTLNDTLFAGYHMLVLAPFMDWRWLPVAFVLLMCASWMWRFSTRYPRGFPLIIVSHFLADLGIVLVGYIRTLPG